MGKHSGISMGQGLYFSYALLVAFFFLTLTFPTSKFLHITLYD